MSDARRAIPIRWKLFATTAVVGLVAALIAVSGLSRMQALNDRMNRIVDISAAKSKLASLMKQELVTVTRAEKNMILTKSEDEMQRHVETIDRTLNELSTNETKLRELVTDETRGQLDQFLAKWSEWQSNHMELRRITRLNSDVRARNLSVGEARQHADQLDRQLATLAKQAREDDVPRIVADLRIAILRMQRIEKNLILASNAEAVDEFNEQLRPLRSTVEQGLQQIEKSGIGEATETLAAAKEAFASYTSVIEQIRDYMGESGNYFVFQLAYGIGGPLADEAEQLLDAIIASSESEIKELQADSGQAYRTARNGLILLSAIGIAASVLVSFLIGDRLARNLGKLATYAREVHDARDLSRPIRVSGNDEVGQVAEALNTMRETVYLQTAELASLNRALTDKSQEMEQFVYTVSHDLKSPLVSCKGLLGLMKEDLADEAYEDVLDSVARMDSATDQLNQIIDDLLELSRIGRKPLDLQYVDVRALVNELVDGLSERIDEAGVALIVDGNLPNVRADASDLRRVFDNLITNAIKYACDVEDARVEVGGTESPHAVRYYVRDNGPGIEPGYQEKIFGLFQRLQQDKEGTGLGLASVRKIARTHGGRAWVESQPNDGATFWIEIPKNKVASG